jgi:hypothetical protein
MPNQESGVEDNVTRVVTVVGRAGMNTQSVQQSPVLLYI